MTDDDLDDRPGFPRGGVAVPPRPTRVEPEADFELRDGETGLGRPPQIPIDARPLSDDDRRRLRLAEEEDALADLAEAEELAASDPAVLGWLGWVGHPLAGAFLAGSAGALGLFLYSQALIILGAIALQPPLIQYVGYMVLALLGALVMYSSLRMLSLFVKLQRNRQIRLDGLAELQSRTRLRWLASAKTAEARERLARYIADYPLSSPPRKLARLGLDAPTVAKLMQVRERLADPAAFASSDDWFLRFRHDFQTPLDEIADARLRYWANRAMLVTAISPNGLVDSTASIYFGFSMVADLCQIYNLRAGRAGTAVLLGRVFFNAYLAGRLNDVEGLIEGHADHAFEQAFSAVGVGVGSNVASKFLGKVGAKATTGYLNRLMLLRLGKYCCRLLRPIA